METIYYSLDAKRLTVCGEAAGRRASGGQETVCYSSGYYSVDFLCAGSNR